MHCNVPLGKLPVGVKLESAIYDQRQVKLLGAGMELTEQLLDTLNQRDVGSVIVDGKDLGRISAFQPQGRLKSALDDRRDVRTAHANDVSRELDRRLETCELPRLTPSNRPFADRLQPTPLRSYDAELSHFLTERREHHVDRVNNLAEACVRGNSSELELLGSVVRDGLQSAVEDVDMFTCLGANPYTHPYPTRHAVHTSMVAASIGMSLGFDERSLTELGIGCLIHDIGMMGIDRMAVGARRQLDADEFIEIARHPIRTFDMIERNLDAVPVAARLVAYQMHERADGSGYPRGRTLLQTHPLARVAAVSDAYTALVSARPHRPGMLPYYAMAKLVKDVARGLYDPQAVRGLLRAVGLFPVGSMVEISGGLVGRVIRSNPHDYSRPIVELYVKSRTDRKPAVADLSQLPDLQILRPLAGLNG